MNQTFIFKKEKVEIFIEDWSDTQYFVYAEYNHHNIHRGITMCDFIEDCEYWGYEYVQSEKKPNGTFGWLFSKKEDKNAIQAQVLGFVYEHSYLCGWKDL